MEDDFENYPRQSYNNNNYQDGMDDYAEDTQHIIDDVDDEPRAGVRPKKVKNVVITEAPGGRGRGGGATAGARRGPPGPNYAPHPGYYPYGPPPPGMWGYPPPGAEGPYRRRGPRARAAQSGWIEGSDSDEEFLTDPSKVPGEAAFQAYIMIAMIVVVLGTIGSVKLWEVFYGKPEIPENKLEKAKKIFCVYHDLNQHLSSKQLNDISPILSL